MSLFQCEHCGGRENTALSCQGIGEFMADNFEWSGIEGRKGMLLCSSCAPSLYSDGEPSGYGYWHDKFPQLFLPMGEFKTNNVGNLEHKETGDTDIEKYAIEDK